MLKTARQNLQKTSKGYSDSLRAVTASQVTIAEIELKLYDVRQGGSVYTKVSLLQRGSVLHVRG